MPWGAIVGAIANYIAARQQQKAQQQAAEDESGGHTVEVNGQAYPNGGNPWVTGAVGALTAYGQYRANKQNRDMAQRQMDFQERMSNTSWQRGIADMRAAGLNPMLGYSKGGADTPGGSTARLENIASPAVASALQSAQTLQGLEATRYQMDVMEADAAAKRSNTALDNYRRALMISEQDQSVATAEQARAIGKNALATMANTNLQTRLGTATFGHSLRKAHSEADRAGSDALHSEMDLTRAANEEAYHRSLGAANPYLRAMGSLVSTAVGARRALGN